MSLPMRTAVIENGLAQLLSRNDIRSAELGKHIAFAEYKGFTRQIQTAQMSRRSHSRRIFRNFFTGLIGERTLLRHSIAPTELCQCVATLVGVACALAQRYHIPGLGASPRD
jgi:hypothetical protein